MRQVKCAKRNLAAQVSPTFADDECSCAASFLWWVQSLAPNERLWEVARTATDHIRHEGEHFGGLAFWARLHASKTLAELATATTPPYSPPYTVRPGCENTTLIAGMDLRPG